MKFGPLTEEKMNKLISILTRYAAEYSISNNTLELKKVENSELFPDLEKEGFIPNKE